MPNSLEVTDAIAAAVAKAPRVTLAEIESSIAMRYDISAANAVHQNGGTVLDGLRTLSLCILIMHNGFTVVGKSAPASPENFNAELGKKFAYEDAIRQLWPLMGYALREKLASQ